MSSLWTYWLAGGALSLLAGGILARRAGLPAPRTLAALAFLGLAVAAGARLHAMLLEEGLPVVGALSDPSRWSTGGLRLPGGIVLSTVLVPLVATLAGLPPGRLADVAGIAVGPLLACGRLACHVGGCCYGTPTALPWGIHYGPGTVAHAVHAHRGWIETDASASLPIHPLALYFSLGALLAAGVALAGHVRGWRTGSPMLAGLAVLGLWCFGVEELRDAFGRAPALHRGEAWLAVGIASALGLALRSRAWLSRAGASAPALAVVPAGRPPRPRRFG